MYDDEESRQYCEEFKAIFVKIMRLDQQNHPVDSPPYLVLGEIADEAEIADLEQFYPLLAGHMQRIKNALAEMETR
jgi:hypothetical protein